MQDPKQGSSCSGLTCHEDCNVPSRIPSETEGLIPPAARSPVDHSPQPQLSVLVYMHLSFGSMKSNTNISKVWTLSLCQNRLAIWLHRAQLLPALRLPSSYSQIAVLHTSLDVQKNSPPSYVLLYRRQKLTASMRRRKCPSPSSQDAPGVI